MIVYMCDSCGKEIPINENRYRIQMGLVSALYDDRFNYKMEKDLCGKCYDKIVSMFKDANDTDNKEDK